MVGNIPHQKIRELVPNFTCGHCQSSFGYQIKFAEHAETYAFYGDFISGSGIAVVTCANPDCARHTIFIFGIYDDMGDFGPSFGDSVEAQLYVKENPEILHCLYQENMPSHLITIGFVGQIPSEYRFGSDVPQSMSIMLNEASNCLTIGSPIAAAVLCRRVIEQFFQHFGLKSPKTPLKELFDSGHMDEFAYNTLSTEPTLQQIIDKAMTEKRFDERLNKPLHEIRKWGNLGAHDDPVGIQHSDVAKLISLTAEILEYSFAPDRLDSINSITDQLAKRRQ